MGEILNLISEGFLPTLGKGKPGNAIYIYQAHELSGSEEENF